MQPATGGRCKKQLIVYEPPTEPNRFKMGIGPALDPTGLCYYRRPDHLRTNRTKNRNPGHTKTLTCNMLRIWTINNPTVVAHVSFLQEEGGEL